MDKGSVWTPIPEDTPLSGKVFVYLSCDFAHLPVRDVMRIHNRSKHIADNKTDPNLETLTYGAISTCGREGRRTMVQPRGRMAFFRTRWHDEVVVTGFYEVGWTLDSWFAYTGESRKTPAMGPDRMLAARQAHFVESPIPLTEVEALIGRETGTLTRNHRVALVLSEDESKTLREELLKQPDATDKYVAEIRRLEAINLDARDYTYINWGLRNSWDWSELRRPILRAAKPEPSGNEVTKWRENFVAPNQWECDSCGGLLETYRPIKWCTQCKHGGAMVPRLRVENEN